MAMSNHQNEAKLKASIAEFVGPLLKRLKIAEDLTKKLDNHQLPNNSNMVKILGQISEEVVKTKDNLDSRENSDKELTGYFGKIERKIEYWIDQYDRTTEWNEQTVSDLEKILKQLSQNQGANPLKAGTKPPERGYHLSQKATINEVGESSNRSYEESRVSMALKCIESLEPRKVRCLYSLGIFPENTELKLRLVNYWWIALGLLPFRADTKRTTEQGELFFSYLVGKDILTPVNIREHNQVIDSCTIKPTIRKHLISGWKRDGYNFSEKWEEGTWHLYGDSRFNMNALLNIDQRYLNSMYISSKPSYRFRVVQLGRWRCTDTEVRNGVKETESEETKSKDHIEVDETDFLKKLGEKVTYLSLRGISGIEELDESVGKLENLMILDLRACHNLEKLPQKSRSTKQKLIRWKVHQKSWFKKLTHLDISECYLLEHMPKWLCELSTLEVLKGFVVGSVVNKNQSCRLGDLSKLNKLRKLSIRITIDISGLEVFRGFNSLNRLLVLTIIWGQNKYNKEIPTYSLPKNIEKLDIRCYPEAEVLSKLQNPGELTKLKRLYIIGGNLTKIPCHDNWNVEILRLRFLHELVYQTDLEELRSSSFKNLKYVEYVGCTKPKNIPNEGSSWHNEE